MRPVRTKDVPPAVCGCTRCRVDRGEVPAGPFTPSEFAGLGLGRPVTSTSTDPTADDPAVKAAEAQRDTARAAFDQVAAEWERAIAAHRSAELLADPYVRNADGDPVGYRGKHTGSPRLAELAEVEKDLREQRTIAWNAVVKANDALRQAQHAARLAAVEAARR